MIPMLPLCDPRSMCMPFSYGAPAMGAPAMIPMVPIANAPICPPMNNISMFSTTSIMGEYDKHMYGRFRHVDRDDPRYRHAPFDWYRPPKQCCNVIHEDAAVVTHDGPVPIGDFYRYYIYGDDFSDEEDDYYEDDDYGDTSSFDSDEYDDTIEPSYEQRPQGYHRNPRMAPNFGDNVNPSRQPMGTHNPTPMTPNRRGPHPSSTMRPTARTGPRGDDFDDAASDNSTYRN